jgi:hypothetical protein
MRNFDEETFTELLNEDLLYCYESWWGGRLFGRAWALD